jgi:cytoskeletal protein CcmA (bactofilin family)
MWKRDESVKPTTPQPPAPAVPVAAPPAPVAAAAVKAPPTSQPTSNDVRGSQIERDKVNIGKSVVIKGELSGSEDLTIEGHVEGKIELRENVLTIGPNGKISAEVFAKAVIVLGEVTGNVTASEKVDIRDNGSVDGDIISPRVAIAEGAHFRGSVDMQRGGSASGSGSRPSAQPAKPSIPAGAPQQQQPAGSQTGQRVGA